MGKQRRRRDWRRNDNRSSDAGSGAGINNVVWISAGWDHVVAIRADGTVWTWGANNWQGSFDCEDSYGNDNNNLGFLCGSACWATALKTTLHAGADSRAERCDHGAGGRFFHHRVAQRWNCLDLWLQRAGQLGVPGIYQSLVPVQVQGLCSAQYIMTRDFHNEALCDNDTLWSWGSGLNGELGNGAKNNSAVPVQVNQ